MNISSAAIYWDKYGWLLPVFHFSVTTHHSLSGISCKISITGERERGEGTRERGERTTERGQGTREKNQLARDHRVQKVNSVPILVLFLP